MENKKTTFAGLITAAAALAAAWGLNLDPKWVTGIIAIGAGAIGIFAKDGK